MNSIIEAQITLKEVKPRIRVYFNPLNCGGGFAINLMRGANFTDPLPEGLLWYSWGMNDYALGKVVKGKRALDYIFDIGKPITQP